MTHPGVDLSVIVSENRRVTHAGRPAGPVRSDLFRPVPVPVIKNPDRFHLCGECLKKIVSEWMNKKKIDVDCVTLFCCRAFARCSAPSAPIPFS